MIINHLHPKTHENTGDKPAKQEMKNKPNMKAKPQHPNPEILKAINPVPDKNQPANNHYLLVAIAFSAKATAKMNSIDNQRLTPQNP